MFRTLVSRASMSVVRPNAMRITPRFFSTHTVTYIEPSGEPVTVTSEDGEETLMTLAIKNNVDMEGACDGQIACSTCHCILPQEVYDNLEKTRPPTDEELDMLDTAFGLSSTSRLGCQLPLKDLPDTVTVTLPSMSR